jgi:hypothetical protein
MLLGLLLLGPKEFSQRHDWDVALIAVVKRAI